MGCLKNKTQISITKKNNTIQNNYKCKNTISLKDKFSSTYHSNDELKQYFTNKSHKITSQLWIKVLDYLSYNELKETGKINRMFNKTVKKRSFN